MPDTICFLLKTLLITVCDIFLHFQKSGENLKDSKTLVNQNSHLNITKHPSTIDKSLHCMTGTICHRHARYWSIWSTETKL